MRRTMRGIALVLVLSASSAQAQFTCRPTGEVSPFGGRTLRCTPDRLPEGPVTFGGGFAQGLPDGLSLTYTLRSVPSAPSYKERYCRAYIEKKSHELAEKQATLTMKAVAELRDLGLEHLIPNTEKIGQNLYQNEVALAWANCHSD